MVSFVHKSCGIQHKFYVLVVKTYTHGVCTASSNIDNVCRSMVKEDGKLAHSANGAIFFFVLGVQLFDVDK